MNNGTNEMFKFLIVTILTIAAVSILLNYLKNILLYHPSDVTEDKFMRFHQRLSMLTDKRENISNAMIETCDGLFLDTIYLKNLDTDKCIIFFHGNSGNLYMRYEMIKFLYNYASVIIFDYRSFGRSSKVNIMNMTASDLLIDAKTVWEYATVGLGYDPNNIVLFGESLGCSIAVGLASILSKTLETKNYPYALVLNAPFYSMTSMTELFMEKIGLSWLSLPMLLLIKTEYASDEWIQYINLSTKIIIAHSPRDEVIPYSEGQRFYQHTRSVTPNVKFITLTGTHSNLGITDSYIYALGDIFNS